MVGRGHQYIHYCSVLMGSPEHLIDGMAVGSPCCNSRADAEEKTISRIHNFLFGRGWAQAVASRWTNVPRTLKRLFITHLSKPPVLTNALQDLRTSWKLGNGSLEDDLLCILQAGGDDFAARNKLKLVRICKMAVTVISSFPIDKLLWKVLGQNKNKPRCLIF